MMEWYCGETYSSHRLKVGRSLVLEVVGVLDLTRSPDALVSRVVDIRSGPLALVVRVLLHGLSPGATARNLSTLGVGNGGSDPVTILLIIPVLGLLGLGIRNGQGLVNKPVLRLGSLLINNLKGSLLIPVIGLLGIGVGDTGLINPVIGLGVLRIVDLLGRVNRGVEVLKEAALLDLLAVLLNDVGVVGVNNQSVELGGLDDLSAGRSGKVLLLILARLGVLVVEDEVDLVGVAALIRAEHDHVRGRVGELLLVESLGVTEELHVSTTALEAICTKASSAMSRV